jgi:FdhD protein
VAIKYEGIKYTAKANTATEDQLIVEEALQININGSPFSVIMQTPGSEKELTLGLLYSEDIARKSPSNYQLEPSEINELGHITTMNVIADTADLGEGYKNSRALLSVSSCGICGKRELGDLKVTGAKLVNGEPIAINQLQNMFSKMRSNQGEFSQTGGSHAAALFSRQGELLALQEDVGRHNAVDKAVGTLLLKGFLSDAHYLLVSGRISYEIVTKAFVAKTPVLAAVSAPSSLAVDYAKEFGITLLGFCREERATCYANPSGLHSL